MGSGGYPSSQQPTRVLEADASPQLVAEINQLLSFDALYTWYTMSEEGSVIDWQHVRSMIDQVGSSYEKTFLVIARTGRPRRFVQCCGNCITGLIVEANSHSGSDLITRPHAKSAESRLITNPRWPYFGADDELHSREAALEIFFEWLVHDRIPSGMERRPRWGMPDDD